MRINMALYDYDLIVIGSGSAGSIAAQQVAKAGKRVAIIESGSFGGSEVVSGRVAISALLQAAGVYETAKHGSRFGIRSTTIGYNYPTVKNWKDLVVKRTGIHSAQDSLSNLGINTLQGRAHFIDQHTVTIGAARYSSREFLIATGSEAVLPDVPGLSAGGFLTTRDVVNLIRPPKKLVILGGSTHSYELAQLFAMFGTKVYFIEPGTRLAPQEEPEVGELLASIFTQTYSMTVLLDGDIEKVETTGIGKKITITQGDKRTAISVDELLIATPKKAATDIGLENAGVEYQEGAILTSATMQTTTKHIYAAGSCTGSSGTGHVGSYQSQVAAHNILHNRTPLNIDYRAVPRAIFTSPEVASVGPTEHELKTSGSSIKSVTAPLSVVTKSNLADYSEGFVKVIASKKTNVILGATIVSPQASELIHELTLAISNYLSADQVARTMHVFPSWSEVIRVACSKLTKTS